MDERVIPGHPRWPEFRSRLAGPAGCDFKAGPPPERETTWKCAGGNDQSLARGILEAMECSPEAVQASLAYYAENGGHCDCEILFNLPDRPELPHPQPSRLTRARGRRRAL
jgi:hypothetical protein